MAINDQLDYSIDSNAFKAYTLGKATDPANTFNKDNLAIRDMAKTVYHFSQSKADLTPRMMSPLDRNLSSADFYCYRRHSHMNWQSKKVAAGPTPYQTREVDQRAVVPQILHTANVEDIDYARKTPIEITAATQMEYMWGLSRAKERLSQFGAQQNVLKFSEVVVAGYDFDNSPSSVAFPTAQLRVITNNAGTGVASIHNSKTGTGTTGDEFVDDLENYVSSLNQSARDCMVVCHHSVRRQLKKIKSYRDLESTVAFLGNENAQVIRYKDFVWVFLYKDAYLNLASLFQGKRYDKSGKIVAADNTLLPSALPGTTNMKTMTLINKSGLGWASDLGAQFSAVGTLEANSFAKVTYMKAGYACGRKDEEKVTVFLYDSAA